WMSSEPPRSTKCSRSTRTSDPLWKSLEPRRGRVRPARPDQARRRVELRHEAGRVPSARIAQEPAEPERAGRGAEQGRCGQGLMDIAANPIDRTTFAYIGYGNDSRQTGPFDPNV